MRRYRLHVAVVLLVAGLLAGIFAVQHLTGRRVILPPAAPPPLEGRLAEAGFLPGQPVYLRIFKEESSLEVWMERNGRYELALTYPVCAWSGGLGPKLREGDKQSPEGFYLVSRKQLKPDSSFHRALNVGFPNAFDSGLGRTGSFLMIHGACVSTGCYAMTDAAIEDIYLLAEQALSNGQEAVPVHIFPFRMSEERLAAAAAEPWSGFWRNLAEGDRLFQATGQPPRAYACGSRYGFAKAGEPSPPDCTPVRPW
jgi:murein L,D-transpeptidase YafK